MTSATFRCGTVALAGRPNTGKSSLLNKLVGEKIAMVSPKAQTTRRTLAGILTTKTCQFVFVDLPGYQTKHINVLNRSLNRAATDGARDCDLVVFVVEALRFAEADREVLARIPDEQRVVLAVNKIDLVKDQGELLPFVERLQKERAFEAIVPVSARSGRNLPELLKVVEGLLPIGPPAYPADQLTDKDERFFASEILREKLFQLLGEELPYRCDVAVESFKEEEGRGRGGAPFRRIEMTIWVERDSQKAIVIGAKGEQLKRISSAARKDMERLFDGKVYLGVWVKVKKDWTGDARLLKQLGYG
jgi:GTP-binding protein Era